ncbi:odorant receptor 10-like [Periplaneta americana]|uniref:odorant receptor 10-like n=1 Tax=Periplaneta americana TaxID=6978 RepID=UPI0037E8BDD2
MALDPGYKMDEVKHPGTEDSPTRRLYPDLRVVELNSMLSLVSCTVVLTGSVLLAFLGFQITVTGNNMVHLPRQLTFVILVLEELGWFCWLADRLSQSSKDICLSVYCGDWIAHSEGIKRSLSFVMARAQRPVQITVGPFGVMSLELYAKVSDRPTSPSFSASYPFILTAFSCLLS